MLLRLLTAAVIVAACSAIVFACVDGTTPDCSKVTCGYLEGGAVGESGGQDSGGQDTGGGGQDASDAASE